MMPFKTPCAFSVIALLLAACNSAPQQTAQPAPAPTSTTPASAPAAKPESGKNLRKGMTEAQIRAVWGEPKAVHAGKEGETILIYHFDVMTTQQMVAATMIERAAVDPFTGEPRIVLEPVLSPQNVTLTQTIVLQLVDGKLASWARKLGEERSFN